MASREPIHVPCDGSDLARLIDLASERTVRLEKDGVIYRLHVEGAQDDLWGNYDPEALRDAIDRDSNLFTPEEAEKMIEQIYEWKRRGSDPPSHLPDAVSHTE